MKKAILAAFLVFAACGRVGDPLPPIVRILPRVDNLSAEQSGYTIVLKWTNPAKYVDGNPATDTGMVHVFRDKVEIGAVAATAAGQPQSFPVPVVRSSVGSPLVFTILPVVPKANKPSPVSDPARIWPVDVPGSPRNLQPIVDKGQIVLTWEPPELNAELVGEYRVQRSDKSVPSSVRVLRFVDEDYEPGKTYKYTVTAVTGTSPQIPGEGILSGDVIAIDKTGPDKPAGLDVQPLTGNAVLVTWEQNTERDLKGYQLFRSDLPDKPIRTGVENVYPDLGYIPGKGISYQVLAEDISGNTSPRSAPKPGP